MRTHSPQKILLTLAFPMLMITALLALISANIAPDFAVAEGLTATPEIYAIPAELSPGGNLLVSGHSFSPGLDLELSLVDASRNATSLGFWQTDGAGVLRLEALLPLLPAGSYQVVATDGNVSASSPLQIRSRLGFSYSPMAGSPGAVIPFTISNLVTGSLRLDYDGQLLFGPVPVNQGSYSGSFVVPNDRPAIWDSAVSLEAFNLDTGLLVGRVSGLF